MSDNISTSNSTSNLSTTDSVCCCSIQICHQKCIKNIDSLYEKIAELTSELGQLRKITEKIALFVLIPNKMTEVYYTAIFNNCCKDKCINKNNLKNGTCISKNGYVNVRSDGKIQYYLAKEKENNFIFIIAQNSFTREKCYSQRYSLFYFEIKMIKETDKDCSARLGFNNDAARIYLNNTNLVCDGYQKFSWNEGDVFGCGVVFQPNKVSNVIVFFTKNGNKIGNKIFLEEINEVRPVIGVKACSVETNFGYDLETKPFIYDVNKHFC